VQSGEDLAFEVEKRIILFGFDPFRMTAVVAGFVPERVAHWW
jgi:hypothetical protein